MATLIPVDGDPFAEDKTARLVPYKGDPFADKPEGAPFTWGGVGHAALAAIPKGVMNIAGTLGSLDDLSKAAALWTANKLGASQATMDRASAMMPGAMSMPGPLRMLFPGTLNPQQIQDKVEQVTGPLNLYEPQNRPEKFADTLTQFMVGMGRPSVGSTLSALGGAAGTEAAGAATNDSGAARFAGGLLGGGIPAAINAWQNAPAKAIRQAVGNPSDAQISDALRMQAGGQQVGVPLMGAESMPNSGLQQLAADVNASRSGAPVMRGFLDARPGQIRSAVQSGLLADVAPYRSPGETAQLAEKTAADVLSGKNADNYMALGSNAARTARTAPFWQEQKTADLTALDQQAQNAQQQTQLQAFLDDLQQQRADRQSSVENALQQWGQMKALSNDATLQAKALNNPGALSMLGKGAYLNAARQSDAAANAAADFSNILARRKGEVGQVDSALQNAQNQLDAIPKPGPSDLQYGLQSIIGNLDSEIGLAGAQTDKGKVLSDLRNQLAGVNMPSQAESVYQAFSRRLNPGATASIEERIAAGILGEPVKALGDLTAQVSGPIGQGRKLYQQITQTQVDPLQSSLVGKMAPKEGFYDPADPTNLSRVVNAATKGVDTSEIRQLYTHLNAQNPQAFPAIARGMLESHFDAATQRVQAGDNRMMGANFAKTVIGTDQQRQNFNEILRGVADAHGVPAQGLIDGAKTLMGTLEATGKVPGVGSPTAGRADLANQLSKTAVGDAVGAVSSRPLSWIKNRYDAAVMGSRYQQLAQLLTAPDSVQQIVKMAKLEPNSVTAKYYASQLFAAGREAQ